MSAGTTFGRDLENERLVPDSEDWEEADERDPVTSEIEALGSDDEDGDEGEAAEEDADEAVAKGKRPAKGRNYMTRKGLEKLKAEYQGLFHGERPKLVETIAWAASNGDRSENADYIYGKRRLREIDRRLRFLSSRMESAVVVDPGSIQNDKVAFGATVTLEDEDSKKVTYQIVGEDESDAQSGKISWLSPVAQALMGKTEGDEVVVQRPAGEKSYTLLKIAYLN